MDRVLMLNPSYARGWFLSGAVRLDLGLIEIAIDHVNISLRLSPRDRIGAHFSVLGSAYLFSSRFDQAEENLLIAIQEHPSHPFPYRLLAACYAHMGRLEEARDIVNRLRAVTPIVVPSVLRYRKPEHRELFLSGLRAATAEA
jgi:adenylate cyclase